MFASFLRCRTLPTEEHIVTHLGTPTLGGRLLVRKEPVSPQVLSAFETRTRSMTDSESAPSSIMQSNRCDKHTQRGFLGGKENLASPRGLLLFY